MCDFQTDYRFLQRKSSTIKTEQMTKMKSEKISNDQELIQSDPISCPQNQKGSN